MEGRSLAGSAGPWCITPGCGVPWGCLLWLFSVWGVGQEEPAGLEVSLPACAPSGSVAAVETYSSPRASGRRRLAAPGLGNHIGVPGFFGLNESL